MEGTDYTVVFEKLSEYESEQVSAREILQASDEIEELRKMVLEVTQPTFGFITTN